MAPFFKRLFALLIGLGFSVGLSIVPVNAQPAPNRRMIVRPVTLKVELFSSLLEIYQANVVRAGFWSDVYQGEMADDRQAAAHFEWLQQTYGAFDESMKQDLDYFFMQAHAWNYVDLLLDLPDNSTIDAIIAFLMQVPEARLVEALGPEAAEHGFRGRLTGFLNRYYRDFLADYLARLAPGSASQAGKMNALSDFDVLQFMEQETGIDAWPPERKTVFYLTTAYMGSMGFERDSGSICLLQADVNSLPEILGTAFHEFGHTLFRSYTRSEGFQALADSLLNSPEMARAQVEFSDSYGPWEFVEENLVDGCSLYLLFRNKAVTAAWLHKVPVYTEFERNYALALTTGFNPQLETLFHFTQRFLTAAIRDINL